MTDKELFQYIKKLNDYTTAGLDVQYKIEIEDQARRINLFFEESMGSIKDQDWKTNLDFPRKVYKNQEGRFYVHRGYVKAWRSCNDQVMAELVAAHQTHPDYYVRIIGWSYGGAMSLLAAEDFHYRTRRKAFVTTFGAPKILYGRRTRKHFLNCAFYYQYTQINDFVTWCIPFPWVHHANQKKCPQKFNLRKLLHTEYTHTHYDEVL